MSVVAEWRRAVSTRHCVNLLFDSRQIQQSLRVVDVVVVVIDGRRDGDDDDRRSPITQRPIAGLDVGVDRVVDGGVRSLGVVRDNGGGGGGVVTGRRRRSTDAVVGDDERRRVAVGRRPALGALRRRLVALSVQLIA